VKFYHRAGQPPPFPEFPLLGLPFNTHRSSRYPPGPPPPPLPSFPIACSQDPLAQDAGSVRMGLATGHPPPPPPRDDPTAPPGQKAYAPTLFTSLERPLRSCYEPANYPSPPPPRHPRPRVRLRVAPHPGPRPAPPDPAGPRPPPPPPPPPPPLTCCSLTY
jgi:hypothetical protein